ncbi:MAG: hypothetical protein M3R72_03705 [Bacteroidota bacterium]|nr:hypothetical protein [Bacteroidota bacterium]
MCLLSCFLFAFVFASFSQTVSATIDRDKIVLGEQITLELKAEGVNPQTALIRSWFAFPDTVNHIEVVKRSPIDTLTVNGTLSYMQTVTITSFDSGNWQLPPLFVLVQKGGETKDSLFTNRLTLQVLPVDVSNLKDYHPMKDIIDVEVKPNYLLIALIIALFVFSAIGLYFLFFKKKQNKKPVLQPVAVRSLYETAIEQLNLLQKQDPPSLPFYTKMDEICRTFLQHQLNIRALQSTSDELMLQLNSYLQGDERTPFYQLLRLMTAVKFAKYSPDDSQKITDINTAKTNIQTIYHHLQSNTP